MDELRDNTHRKRWGTRALTKKILPAVLLEITTLTN